MISRGEQEPAIAQGREVALEIVAPAGEPSVQLSSRVLRLAENYRQRPDKQQTTIRFEQWLNTALDDHISHLKLKGYRRITREAIITEAVIQYLGVKPPVH